MDELEIPDEEVIEEHIKKTITGEFNYQSNKKVNFGKAFFND
jgi:hypothetical protein